MKLKAITLGALIAVPNAAFAHDNPVLIEGTMPGAATGQGPYYAGHCGT